MSSPKSPRGVSLFVISVVLLSVIASATGKPARLNSTEEALIRRTTALTGNGKGYLIIIPKPGLLSGRDFASKVAATLPKQIADAAAENQPIVIYCPDRAFATKVIVLAFGPMRKASLSKATIICAVGPENDGKIRPAIEATGAKLYVEPLP